MSEKLDRLASLLSAHTPERLAVFWGTIMARKKPASATLSQTIADIIRERELTAYALGRSSGVSATVIQLFLNGERGLTLKTAERLAAALDLVLVPREVKT